MATGAREQQVSCSCNDSISMQEINVQNMNVELVAQMFKNYQSNVLFHLEGKIWPTSISTEVQSDAGHGADHTGFDSHG